MSKSLAAIIVAGFTYDPGHSDLDNEQPINVCMTLGDYRRAGRELHYKSPQLLALKSAERFVIAKLDTLKRSYLPNPIESEIAELFEAQNVLSIIQDAIVKGEIEFAKSWPT